MKAEEAEMGEDSGATEGRRRRERREDVRAKLVAAAYGVFCERGYEGASLERVAEAAGYSKGAVYSNFSGKEELFFELVSSRIDERIDAVRAATERKGAPGKAAGDPGQAARAAGKLLREVGEADPKWQLLFLEFWLRCARSDELRAKLADRRRAMRGRIADLIQVKVEAAGASLGRAEAMDLATTALALSNGFGVEGIIDPKAAPPRLLGETLSHIVAGALGRPSAPGVQSRAKAGGEA